MTIIQLNRLVRQMQLRLNWMSSWTSWWAYSVSFLSFHIRLDIVQPRSSEILKIDYFTLLNCVQQPMKTHQSNQLWKKVSNQAWRLIFNVSAILYCSVIFYHITCIWNQRSSNGNNRLLLLFVKYWQGDQYWRINQ